MATTAIIDPSFPCSLLIHIPFPTHRLARTALGTLSVDEELSPLVIRSFALVATGTKGRIGTHSELLEAENTASPRKGLAPASPIELGRVRVINGKSAEGDERLTVLRVDYKATTNRMLRVAVNGFFESLGVVMQVMEELDVDVLHEKGSEGLEGVQGVEQGMTGTTLTGA
ncbi:hypothetical protein LTR53_006563 [Teratosphaeriaceae sp. CCFEE 6253]|nr:hypothetical protein LTR53_006563 [Teratosphaeriaceae sp. CCFEE 6253]